MTNEIIKIKIDSAVNGEKADLTVAELGVLLTAINRGFNQVPREGRSLTDVSRGHNYDRINFEPALIELKVSSITKGCVELEVLAKAMELLNNLPEPQRTMLLGALGSGTWDVSKTLGKHFTRAIKRIAIASTGKVITVAIKVKGKTSKFIATIGAHKDVDIRSEKFPPDDIQ